MTVKMGMMPDWFPLLSELLVLFKEPMDDQSFLANETLTTLDSLTKSVEFFRNLVASDITFSGRIHCEASLASLISPSAFNPLLADGLYPEVLSVTQVSNHDLACFYHQNLIPCDRISEMSLAYQNVAARHAVVS